MFCRKCGNELKEGEKICSKCGFDMSVAFASKSSASTPETQSSQTKSKNTFNVIIAVVLLIIAFVVVKMSFEGADMIERAGSSMMRIESVSGNSIDEAYFQDYGRFLEGLAIVVKAIGITCGVVVAYIGIKMENNKG